MAYLYRHVRIDTNVPFYIGVGNDKRNYRRAHDIILRSKYWKHITSKTDFEVHILLDNISYDEILEKEIEFISLYGRNNIGNGTLVNLTDGGVGTNGCKFSDEARKKASERVLGYKHPFFGKKHSHETIKKMIDIKTGKKASASFINFIIKRNTGKKKSERTVIALISACSKAVIKYDIDGNFISEYISLSSAAKENNLHINSVHFSCNKINRVAGVFMFRYKTGTIYPLLIEKYIPNNTQSRSVLQYDKKGIMVKEFKSINLAAKLTMGNASCIQRVCNGERKSHAGYMWIYKDIHNG
ncbi:MAG: NUMOD3 domain-containing DNA-binding protein [Ferruginibacter sp.]